MIKDMRNDMVPQLKDLKYKVAEDNNGVWGIYKYVYGEYSDWHLQEKFGTYKTAKEARAAFNGNKLNQTLEDKIRKTGNNVAEFLLGPDWPLK